MTFDLRGQGGQKLIYYFKIRYTKPVSDSKPLQASTFDLRGHWRSDGGQNYKKIYLPQIRLIFSKF